MLSLDFAWYSEFIIPPASTESNMMFVPKSKYIVLNTISSISADSLSRAVFVLSATSL